MKNNLNEMIYGKYFADDIQNMTEEQLKKEFIKWLGEEKWNEEEALSDLMKISMIVCNDLYIEPLPVIVEDLEEESRLYIKDEYIAINRKLIFNKLEALKGLIYQLRLYYQIVTCTIDDESEPLVEQWKKDYAIVGTDEAKEAGNYMMLYVDAFAYTKYMIQKLTDYRFSYPDIVYDEIVNQYIKKYFEN